MHNYVSNIGENHIQMTISMYGHYLKYYNDQAVLGGIIGGSFFICFIYCLGPWSRYHCNVSYLWLVLLSC